MQTLAEIPVINYAVHPDYAPLAETVLRDSAMKRLTPLLDTKRAQMDVGAEGFLSRPADSADPAISKLARVGAYGVRLSSKRMDRIRAAAERPAAALRARVDAMRAKGEPVSFPDTYALFLDGQKAVSGMEDIAAEIHSLIRKSGILDIASAYYPGFVPSASGAAIKYNFADHDIFRASGRPTTRTGAIHIDSNDLPVMNGIIYLNEVGPKQGPFSYIIGSNRWAFDPEDRVIRKAVDESGFGGRNGRKYFAALPEELRRKAAFGWDLEDDTPESRAILAAEKRFCSDKCDMVLFDSDGAHRGGGVLEGERLSILFHVKMRAT